MHDRNATYRVVCSLHHGDSDEAEQESRNALLERLQEHGGRLGVQAWVGGGRDSEERAGRDDPEGENERSDTDVHLDRPNTRRN